MSVRRISIVLLALAAMAGGCQRAVPPYVTPPEVAAAPQPSADAPPPKPAQPRPPVRR